jgi:hypothetical protein
MKLPQLSLRELFLLVVIAAMGCGWWLERNRLANRLSAAETELEKSQLLLTDTRAENGKLRKLIADLTIQLAKPGWSSYPPSPVAHDHEPG